MTDNRPKVRNANRGPEPDTEPEESTSDQSTTGDTPTENPTAAPKAPEATPPAAQSLTNQPVAEAPVVKRSTTKSDDGTYTESYSGTGFPARPDSAERPKVVDEETD